MIFPFLIPSGLYSNITSSEKPPLATLLKVTTLPLHWSLILLGLSSQYPSQPKITSLLVFIVFPLPLGCKDDAGKWP